MVYNIYLDIDRAFDVELLYIAQQLRMPIKEVAINWQEIEGKFLPSLLLLLTWLLLLL